MANKQGGLLATLGKRILGSSTSSSGCCAAPTAGADETNTSEPKDSGVKPVGVKTFPVSAAGTGCCGGASGTPAAPAGRQPPA